MKETQCSPWPWRRWFRPKLGGSGGGFGRGRGGEGRGAHRGSICAHERGREALGGGFRRWQVVSAAGASAPVKGAAPAIYRRHKEVEGVRVELLGAWLVLARPGDKSSPWGVPGGP
jgi:hypothetical protein